MNETQVNRVNEDLENPAREASAIGVVTPSETPASQVVVPAQGCPTCGGVANNRVATQTIPDPWVYVIGDVDPKYPSLAVEKEAIGAMARAKVSGLSNDAALQKVLEAPGNEYIVREMCFVLLVQEVETYILVPRSPLDYPMLVEAAKSELSAVIGSVGPIADPAVCNGLTLPYLIFDVVFNFDKPAFIADIPLPKGADEAKFRATANEIFGQIATLIPTGRGMERALAYLFMKDPNLYQVIWNAYNQNAQLTSIETKPAPVNSTQNLVDVMITTTDRSTGVQNCVYARVATAHRLPYVVNYWRQCLNP
jgi:hypothetical protein